MEAPLPDPPVLPAPNPIQQEVKKTPTPPPPLILEQCVSPPPILNGDATVRFKKKTGVIQLLQL